MAGPDAATLDRIAARILALPPAPLRLRIAIAGPPGAGKSTFAAALVDRLGPEAALVPMDGFHLDNAILTARGLLPRKGAPETFDALGFVRMVERLGQDAEVVIPGFDRTRDIAIAGAAVVAPSCRIAVVEGNYLLLRTDPGGSSPPSGTSASSSRRPADVLETRPRPPLARPRPPPPRGHRTRPRERHAQRGHRAHEQHARRRAPHRLRGLTSRPVRGRKARTVRSGRAGPRSGWRTRPPSRARAAGSRGG